jgi:hypothetical protein
LLIDLSTRVLEIQVKIHMDVSINICRAPKGQNFI